MDKYLIITGGTRGIGQKTIERFLQDDWYVVNIARSHSTQQAVKNIQLDLSQPMTEVHIEQIKNQLGVFITKASHICLVHNAVYYKHDYVPTLNLHDLYLTLQTNLIAAIVLNQAVIPHMLAGSSIIYIGSTLAEKAVPGSASYTISKHAMIGLMRATCQDLIEQQIRSCCICPGLVNTELLKETMEASVVEYLLQNKIIGKRLIEPQEIANIIHFCAVTSSLNGAIIHANLGQFAE